MALMDFKELYDVLIQTLQSLGRTHEFVRDLVQLTSVGNMKEQKALQMAIKTNSTEYKSFANTISSIKNGGWLMLAHGWDDERSQSLILTEPVDFLMENDDDIEQRVAATGKAGIKLRP